MSLDFAAPSLAPSALPAFALQQGRYRLRFASSLEDVDRALRLRFEVFNRELGEGLAESWRSEPRPRRVRRRLRPPAGRGRAQRRAGRHLPHADERHGRPRACGFYSAREFALESLPAGVLGAIGRARPRLRRAPAPGRPRAPRALARHRRVRAHHGPALPVRLLLADQPLARGGLGAPRRAGTPRRARSRERDPGARRVPLRAPRPERPARRPPRRRSSTCTCAPARGSSRSPRSIASSARSTSWCCSTCSRCPRAESRERSAAGDEDRARLPALRGLRPA